MPFLFLYKMAEQFVEAEVCAVNDLQDGEMKEVEVGGTKVLLCKHSGAFHAIGTKCSHYGAPLINGVLCNGHVRCPWHGACFNIASGDIEDYPGIDSIPRFETIVKGDKVVVKAAKSTLEKAKRVKTMTVAKPGDKTTVLIIGGGPSAATCAETLRQEGYQGRIVMATKEKHLPYDRPKLSKALSVTVDQISLRDKKFYDDNHIEVSISKEATKVDVAHKKVSFADGTDVTYDKLVLAIGTVPRVLTTIPGHDLQNISTLRSVDDAQFIAEHTEGKDVVILGTSFIGVEVAATLAGKAKSVTIVDMVEAPFQLALGKDVGNAVKKVLSEKGVQFRFQNTIKQFVGEGGKLKKVILKDDTTLPADFCVMGVGVVPATDFLKGSGLDITDRGFVVVNKQMRTSQDGVYAVGDITQFPLFMISNQSANIQHWQMALQQGRIAAMNIAGKATDIHSVPFFWTVVCGKSLRYTGYGVGYDETIIHGSLDELKFVAYYLKAGNVIAVASLNSDPVAAQAAELFLSGITLTKAELQADPTGLAKKLKSVSISTRM